MKSPFASRVLSGLKRLFAPLAMSLAVLIGGHNPTPPGNNSPSNDNKPRKYPAPLFWDAKIAPPQVLHLHAENDSLFFPPFLSPDDRPQEDSLTSKRQLRAVQLFGSPVNIKNKKAPFYYPKRYGENFPETHTTASEPEDSVDASVKELWQILQRLKTSKTIIGPALVDFSVRAKIIYADSNPVVGSGGPTLYGGWFSKEGVVRVNNDPNASPDFKMLVMTHETIHAIQKSTQKVRRSTSLPMHDFQAIILTYEAAAVTGTYLLALELYLQEDYGLWGELQRLYPERCEDILEEWDRIQGGKTAYGVSSLDKLGKFIFKLQIQDQQWMDGENARALKFGLKAIYDNKIKKNAPERTYTQEDAERVGYISPEFNFTAGMNMKSLFKNPNGNNESMAHAMDFVEMKRLAYAYGHDSKKYREFRETLRENDNPFINLDIKEIWDSYLHINEIKPLIWVMEELANGRDLMAINIDDKFPLPQAGNTQQPKAPTEKGAP